MHMWVSDLLTHIEEDRPCCRYLVINSCKRTLPEIWFSVKHWLFLLALNDHVVQDDTASHDLPHLIFRPGLSRVPDNSKSRLKHTKCPLDILPASLLNLRKVGLLASWHRVSDSLHKYRPS